MEYVLQFNFRISNNEVEYEVLITRLRLTKGLRIKDLKVFSNSHLVVSSRVDTKLNI